jgi:hypothetical protein
LFESGGCFVGGGGHDALRDGDAGFAEELLALVFVDLHLGTLTIAAAVDSGYVERKRFTQRRRGRGGEEMLGTLISANLR